MSMERGVTVYDTDGVDLPGAITRGEVCTLLFQRGNFSTEVRITRDEAKGMIDGLGIWLRESRAGL